MLKSYKYQIYPTHKQRTAMQSILNECRWLYNHLLEERNTSWETKQESLNYYKQAVSIPKLKKERGTLAGVHSQVLQNVAVRVDLAYKAFFRRVKAGEKPGFPRFKGYNWYDSFTFPQVPVGCCIKDGKLRVAKLGDIKIKLHRGIEGKVKTCAIRRISGKWFACFTAEVEAVTLPAVNQYIGIDVGLESFATFSDGTKIENPRFFRRDEQDLARIQRKLSKAEKGSKERAKRRKAVAKVHERIKNRRADFAHQRSVEIIKKFDVICVEDLSINNMVHNHCLAKSISDVAWGQFSNYLSYKAESAGRKLVKVNPAYTSQTCSKCGHRQKIPLSTRTFHCPCCNLSIDRDLNASLNILALGLQSIGIQSVEAPEFIHGE